MKLVIQVPCFNEAATICQTLKALPRTVDGFDVTEVLVIDDGSVDNTATVARVEGGAHVIRMNGHQGLARAFLAGLAASLRLGADVVVNTDADNQYQASCIPDLVRPIIAGRADIVIGARPVRTMADFSLTKKLLQHVGSFVVRALVGADVRDAPCGFRAFSRAAAQKMNVFGSFTYTIETILQATFSNLRIVSVPVRVNDPIRPSRLFRSNVGYVCRATGSIVSGYAIYRPVRLFGLMAGASFAMGLLLALRYLYLMSVGEGIGHVQSVVMCAGCLLAGLLFAVSGCLAHLHSINRRLLEELRYFVLSRPGTQIPRRRRRCGRPPKSDEAPDRTAWRPHVAK